MDKINDIIDQILKGQQDAERQLYDLFKLRWYLLAKRYSRTIDEANDILQEGLIQIYSDLHQFDSTKAQFSTWSNRVLVHAALKYLKKNQWMNIFLEDELSQTEESKGEDIYSSLATNELIALIQNLPLGYKLVFNMNVLEGYTHKEIALKLNITEGTSKSQLFKAKKELRKQLEKQLNYIA